MIEWSTANLDRSNTVDDTWQHKQTI